MQNKPKTIIRATAAFKAIGTELPNIEIYSTISSFSEANKITDSYQTIIHALREHGHWYCEATGQWVYRPKMLRKNYTGSKLKNVVVVSDVQLSDITAMSQAKFLIDHQLGSEGYHFFTKNAPKGNRNATIRYRDWVIARKVVQTPIVIAAAQGE